MARAGCWLGCLLVVVVPACQGQHEADAPARAGARVGPFPVVAVVDGDTLKVNMPERTTIRVIGIDTPETVDPRRPVQCFGAEASARAHALLDGKSVSLEFDTSQGREDRYGRTLAYVWLPSGRSFNETMIAQGYAHEYTYDTPYRYQHAYQQAETEARRADRGLWAPGVCS